MGDTFVRSGAPQVAAYGKLPWAPDFVSTGHVPHGSSLLDWVEQGIALGAQRGPAWREAFERGCQTGFVRVSPVGSLLCGVMAPSQDEIGRRFPFLVYSEVDPGPLRSVPHAAPLVLGGFLQEAGTLISELSLRAAELSSEVPRVVPPDLTNVQAHLEGYDGWAQSATIRTAGQAIFGADWRSGLRFSLYVAIESIRPFYGQETPPTPLAVRFPVGAGFAGAAAFWIHVVRLCAGWSETIPHCFWSFDPGGSSVTVFFGQVSPAAFADLWEPDPHSDTLSNLVRSSYPEDDLLRQLRPDVSELVGREGATIGELLALLQRSPAARF